MYLKLKNPLSFFDLEATGTNISKDRIIEISVLKVLPNGETSSFNTRLNPEMPIPAETSLIHGIYDEDIKEAPTFKKIARNLAKFLEGSDLAGFSIIRFDVPLLVEEFLRADVDFEVSNRKLIDAQKIFHLMEKRTLSAAYQFYCQKSLEDAHSAEADTLATFEVLDAQIRKYEGKDVVDNLGNKLGMVNNDMKALHEITCTNMVDLAGRFILNENGEEIINFGKYKNRKVVDVLKKEPNYYDWIMKGDFPLDTKRKLTQIKLRGLKF